MDLSNTYDEEMKELLEKRLSYQYPYKADINLHTKMSVSELKKQGQDIDDKNSLYQPLIPEFLKEQSLMDEEETGISESGASAGGAVRGNAYHRILELLDFATINPKKDVELWIENACQEGFILKEMAAMARPEKLWRFVQSPLGKRIVQAQKEGRLYREQQFVLGISAKEMGLAESEELVLIQGVIDAWIEEPEGLVLIDYKTDRISQGEEEVLVKRYQVQIDYYRRALEQMIKKKVTEKIIYSLALQKEILV